MSCAFNNKKTGAFCWNNNCIIINMHGKTTIKTVLHCLKRLCQFNNTTIEQ
jgi:hypothetical protein